MKNIFVAVGGSGTKVAEALVRLLAIGFPTKETGDEVYTSKCEDTLHIWRLDPDRNSGAAHALDQCVVEYKELQKTLEDHWSMDMPGQVVHLDPLDLRERGGGDNKIKSLEGILDSQVKGKKSSRPFLDLFYEEKDLEVKVERGFYQKPFIGAALVALFAESLLDPNSDAGGKCNFKELENEDVRFFLCGSLYGGTGACGVPVLGQFLDACREEGPGKWDLGACLLGPYYMPPPPPFTPPKNGGMPSSEDIKNLIKANEKHPAFVALGDIGKEELAKQILYGFFADPDAAPKRASHSLSYYEDNIAQCFDELFLVSKPTPDSLARSDEKASQRWSNGGTSQNNPLNSAEIVAAIAALNFFGESVTPRGEHEIYTIASSTENLNPQSMNLYELPIYKLNHRTPIDPERAYLASAIARHLIIHQINWELKGSGFSEAFAIRKVYEKDETRKNRDKEAFDKASALMIKFIRSTVSNDEAQKWETRGWSPDVAKELTELLATDKKGYENVQEKLKKSGVWGKLWKSDANLLGQSKVILDSHEFASWSVPNSTFNRGDYWRYIWSRVYSKIESAEKVATQATGK